MDREAFREKQGGAFKDGLIRYLCMIDGGKDLDGEEAGSSFQGSDAHFERTPVQNQTPNAVVIVTEDQFNRYVGDRDTVAALLRGKAIRKSPRDTEDTSRFVLYRQSDAVDLSEKLKHILDSDVKTIDETCVDEFYTGWRPDIDGIRKTSYDRASTLEARAFELSARELLESILGEKIDEQGLTSEHVKKLTPFYGALAMAGVFTADTSQIRANVAVKAKFSIGAKSALDSHYRHECNPVTLLEENLRARIDMDKGGRIFDYTLTIWNYGQASFSLPAGLPDVVGNILNAIGIRHGPFDIKYTSDGWSIYEHTGEIDLTAIEGINIKDPRYKHGRLELRVEGIRLLPVDKQLKLVMLSGLREHYTSKKIETVQYTGSE